jgi:hypothetical protein
VVVAIDIVVWLPHHARIEILLLGPQVCRRRLRVPRVSFAEIEGAAVNGHRRSDVFQLGWQSRRLRRRILIVKAIRGVFGERRIEARADSTGSRGLGERWSEDKAESCRGERRKYRVCSSDDRGFRWPMRKMTLPVPLSASAVMENQERQANRARAWAHGSSDLARMKVVKV